MEVDAVELIRLVQKRNPIYNKNCKEHANKNLTDKLWDEIAKEINYPVSECRSKWASLRSSYNRHLREESLRRKNDPSTPGSTKKKTKWYLADKLEFLRDIIHQHRARRNYTSVAIHQNDDTTLDEIALVGSPQSSVSEQSPSYTAKENLLQLSSVYTLQDNHHQQSTPSRTVKEIQLPLTPTSYAAIKGDHQLTPPLFTVPENPQPQTPLFTVQQDTQQQPTPSYSVIENHQQQIAAYTGQDTQQQQLQTSSYTGQDNHLPIPFKMAKPSEVLMGPMLEFLQSRTKPKEATNANSLFFQLMLTDFENLSKKNQRKFRQQMNDLMLQLQEEEENERTFY